MCAACVDVVFAVGIALVRLLYLSTVITKNWFSVLALDSVSNISIEKKYIALDSEKVPAANNA